MDTERSRDQKPFTDPVTPPATPGSSTDTPTAGKSDVDTANEKALERRKKLSDDTQTRLISSSIVAIGVGAVTALAKSPDLALRWRIMCYAGIAIVPISIAILARLGLGKSALPFADKIPDILSWRSRLTRPRNRSFGTIEFVVYVLIILLVGLGVMQALQEAFQPLPTFTQAP